MKLPEEFQVIARLCVRLYYSQNTWSVSNMLISAIISDVLKNSKESSKQHCLSFWKTTQQITHLHSTKVQKFRNNEFSIFPVRINLPRNGTGRHFSCRYMCERDIDRYTHRKKERGGELGSKPLSRTWLQCVSYLCQVLLRLVEPSWAEHKRFSDQSTVWG